MRIKSISILLLTVTCLYAKAQSPYFAHYQVEQGLSNNTVLCSIQARDGFLWFGTKDGLNRFDGYSFKTFRQDPDSPGSINSNFIRVLFEDKLGIIWAGTDQGIFLFDPKSESFTLFHPDIVKETIAISADSSDNIWFITDLRLFKYDQAHGTLLPVESSFFSEATTLSTTRNGALWVGGLNGTINKYNPQNNTFSSYNVFNHSKSAVSNWIEKIYDTGKGYLLIGTTKQGVKSFDLQSDKYADLLSQDDNGADLFVRNIIQRTRDEYWIASESGIYIYRHSSGTFTNLRKQYNNPWSLTDNAVYTLCTDKEGGLWIGTYFGGINYYTEQNTIFEKFFPMAEQHSLSGQAVREICRDDYGNIWIGTEDGGLNKLDKKTNTFINFKPTGEPGSISNINIHGLLASGDTLWIGTFEHGLDLMDIKSGKIIKHYKAGSGEGSLKNNFIFNIYKTRKGHILLATGRGVYQYNPLSKDFHIHPGFPEYIFYTTLLEDSKGTIWAGTWRDGLYYCPINQQERGFYIRHPQKNNSLSNNRVTRIFEDSAKNIWVATEGGLCKLNDPDKTFERYTTNNGLPGNLILNLLEDENRNLWITTSKGLARYNSTKQEITTYTIANGLLSDQFNYNSGYRDNNGDLYFGSVKGLIRFNPKNFKDSDYQPPVFITGFQLFNQELEINGPHSPLTKSITFTDTIHLKYNQSTFSIDFAALSFTAAGMLSYAYKMEGLEKTWTRIRTNRKIFFTQLSPGQYLFRVNVVNPDGSPKGKETRLYIQISPPFWASTVAYVFYVLTLLALTWYAIRSYHHHIREKNRRKLELMRHKKEKELYNAKIDFFTNVAHEIRTPLTLIKAPLEKVIKRADEVPGIQKYLITMERNTERLIELTGQLLDFRKTEAKRFSLSFTEIDVKTVVEENYLRFKSAAEEKKIRIRLALPQFPLIASIDTEAVHKIISNLLNNALKYAANKIMIVVTTDVEETHTFSIQIKSDGYLIPYDMRDKIFETFYRLKATEKQSGTGLGLALSRSLAQLHNGSLRLLPPEDGLNIFCLTLPVKQTNVKKIAKTT